ncbi:MAG: hypothetical protein SGPRY_003913, partial [Prymnesium sp.]
PMLALSALSLATHVSFEQCVGTQLGANTPFLTNGDPDFTSASKCLNARTDLESVPDAVVRVQTVSDVQTTVSCAATYEVEISVRSGSHSFENESCRGRVIIDVSDLLSFSFDPTTEQVTWGSGHTNGQLYMKLIDEGYVFPGGTESHVGTGGLVLGCGRGMLTSFAGRSCDLVQEVEYVDNTGTLRVANAAVNSDMLWMARGGGGEFPGVITKYTALAKAAPPTVHKRDCDQGNAINTGKQVITQWVGGLEEMSKSARKTYTYIHFYPNTGTIWVRHKCFGCDETELAWFESHTGGMASAAGGVCGPLIELRGAHPSQVVNMFAEEPGAGSADAMRAKAHYWPGENQGIFSGSSTSGSYYVPTYSVDQGMLDDMWELIYNNPPASTGPAFLQQFYLYPMENDAVTPSDSVGGAFNGYKAKWILHFKMAWQGEAEESDWLAQHRALSSLFASYLPCHAFYNYLEIDLPCASTRAEMLAAYMSDPQRLTTIKGTHDPYGLFRSPLLSWTAPPPSPPSSPPSPNIVEYVGPPRVGEWGGLCTCPNGEEYYVGDNFDSCASLACIDGISDGCSSNIPSESHGVRVTCAKLPPSPPPTIAPTSALALSSASSALAFSAARHVGCLLPTQPIPSSPYSSAASQPISSPAVLISSTTT